MYVPRSALSVLRFRKPDTRNGTQPELRLERNFIFFEIFHSVDERKGWKISSFEKLEIELKY